MMNLHQIGDMDTGTCTISFLFNRKLYTKSNRFMISPPVLPYYASYK